MVVNGLSAYILFESAFPVSIVDQFIVSDALS